MSRYGILWRIKIRFAKRMIIKRVSSKLLFIKIGFNHRVSRGFVGFGDASSLNRIWQTDDKLWKWMFTVFTSASHWPWLIFFTWSFKKSGGIAKFINLNLSEHLLLIMANLNRRRSKKILRRAVLIRIDVILIRLKECAPKDTPATQFL